MRMEKKMLKIIKKECADITLSELIDKYVEERFVNVVYQKNGDVSVWISGLRKDEKKESDNGERTENNDV